MQEVTVENRQTGQRKRMTPVAAQHLYLKYRIVTDDKPDPNFKPDEPKKTDLEKLRLQYFELFGQQPHHRLGEAKLKQLIDEEKSKQ